MKALRTIGKNLKLLFRSKESAYTIIFGPILIILLVSFAFMGSSDDYALRVGTYTPAQTQLSDQATARLAEHGYIISEHADQDSCAQSVKSGRAHACIAFSDREVGNGTVPISLYLDMSRTNVAYKVADDLSEALDLEADEIRAQLAGDALSRMSNAADSVQRNIDQTEAMRERVVSMQEELAAARAALASITTDGVNVSVSGVRGYQLGLHNNARIIVNESIEVIERADRALWKLETDCRNCSERTIVEAGLARGNLTEAREKILEISEIQNAQLLSDADYLLKEVNDGLVSLNASLARDTAARQAIADAVVTASADAEANARELQQITKSLRQTKEVLSSQTADEDTISKPVAISVASVASEDDTLSFTYPYLLILVIMFIGMLLASTLIVADKTSQARFRNFTTPPSDEYHITIAFFTAFLLLCAETAVILLLSKLFVAESLMFLSVPTLMVILIAIVLFTFIGMIIGYLASTQEAAMISSISIGSVLLFASNLIIPVEAMSGVIQSISGFNPYLVLSELLRKSMFYAVPLQQESRQLLMLLILCGALLAVTLLIERRTKRKYFKQDGGILAPHIPSPLALGERQVFNEVELLDALDHMTRTEFEAVIKSDDNPISIWAAKELRNRRLARKLRTTSKERMMLRLDEYLKKHGKSIKR